MGNVNTIYKQFLAPPNYEQWIKLENQLTSIDKIYLGYPYKVWHDSCSKLYGITHSDYPLIVTEFILTEYTVMKSFVLGEEWTVLPMMIIYNTFSNPKHKKFIDSVLTDPKISNNFKETINNYLLDAVV